jgi:type III pantothenate kinase
MKLLVDFGNTRLKWATLAGAQMRLGGVFAHLDKPAGPQLRVEWGELARVDAVLVASVVASAREDELAAFVRERFGARATFLRSPAAALGVRNAYAEPERLGIDRFLALAALHAQQPGAHVLASAGTALTIDALDAGGIHRGGVIVPGPTLMRAAVLGGTARVASADGVGRPLPNNTADALVTGALYACAGAIDRFRAAAAHASGMPQVLTLTGGGADELAPLLPDAQRAHDLVLRGLALWAEADTEPTR